MIRYPFFFSVLFLIKQFWNTNKWNVNNKVSFRFAGGDIENTRNVDAHARKLLENATVQYVWGKHWFHASIYLFYNIYVHLCLICIGQCSSRNASTLPRIRTNVYIPREMDRKRERIMFSERNSYALSRSCLCSLELCDR